MVENSSNETRIALNERVELKMANNMENSRNVVTGNYTICKGHVRYIGLLFGKTDTYFGIEYYNVDYNPNLNVTNGFQSYNNGQKEVIVHGIKYFDMLDKACNDWMFLTEKEFSSNILRRSKQNKLRPKLHKSISNGNSSHHTNNHSNEHINNHTYIPSSARSSQNRSNNNNHSISNGHRPFNRQIPIIRRHSQLPTSSINRNNNNVSPHRHKSEETKIRINSYNGSDLPRQLKLDQLEELDYTPKPRSKSKSKSKSKSSKSKSTKSKSSKSKSHSSKSRSRSRSKSSKHKSSEHTSHDSHKPSRSHRSHRSHKSQSDKAKHHKHSQSHFDSNERYNHKQHRSNKSSSLKSKPKSSKSSTCKPKLKLINNTDNMMFDRSSHLYVDNIMQPKLYITHDSNSSNQSNGSNGSSIDILNSTTSLIGDTTPQANLTPSVELREPDDEADHEHGGRSRNGSLYQDSPTLSVGYELDNRWNQGWNINLSVINSNSNLNKEWHPGHSYHSQPVQAQQIHPSYHSQHPQHLPQAQPLYLSHQSHHSEHSHHSRDPQQIQEPQQSHDSHHQQKYQQPRYNSSDDRHNHNNDSKDSHDRHDSNDRNDRNDKNRKEKFVKDKSQFRSQSVKIWRKQRESVQKDMNLSHEEEDYEPASMKRLSAVSRSLMKQAKKMKHASPLNYANREADIDSEKIEIVTHIDIGPSAYQYKAQQTYSPQRPTLQDAASFPNFCVNLTSDDTDMGKENDNDNDNYMSEQSTVQSYLTRSEHSQSVSYNSQKSRKTVRFVDESHNKKRTETRQANALSDNAKLRKRRKRARNKVHTRHSTHITRSNRHRHKKNGNNNNSNNNDDSDNYEFENMGPLVPVPQFVRMDGSPLPRASSVGCVSSPFRTKGARNLKHRQDKHQGNESESETETEDEDENENDNNNSNGVLRKGARRAIDYRMNALEQDSDTSEEENSESDAFDSPECDDFSPNPNFVTSMGSFDSATSAASALSTVNINGQNGQSGQNRKNGYCVISKNFENRENDKAKILLKISKMKAPPSIETFFSNRKRRKYLLNRKLPSLPVCYNVIFDARPLGFWIQSLPEERRNAYVTQVNPKLHNCITIGSQILCINDASMVGKTFGKIVLYLSEAKMPMKITFAKPRKRRKHSNLSDSLWLLNSPSSISQNGSQHASPNHSPNTSSYVSPTRTPSFGALSNLFSFKKLMKNETDANAKENSNTNTNTNTNTTSGV